MAIDMDRIQKDIRKLRKFLKAPPKRPSPHVIHSLRTRTRRLQAALQAFAAGTDRLSKKLKRIRHAAGNVRDLDVLTGYIMMVQVPDKQECRVELLEYLGAERYRRSEQLIASALKHGPFLRRRLKRISAQLEALDSAPDNTSTNSASEEMAASALQLSRELAIPTRLDRDNLHPYRITVKKLLFLLLMQKSRSNSHLIDALGEVKDAIGEWHDWQELAALAEKQLGHTRGCELLRSFEAIRDQKFKHALSVTNRMRERYFSSSLHGRHGGSKGKSSASDAVMSAIAAMME